MYKYLKNEVNNDYSMHLQPPTSHQACCTFMKKGEKARNTEEKDSLQGKGRKEEKKRPVMPPNGSFCKKKISGSTG